MRPLEPSHDILGRQRPVKICRLELIEASIAAKQNVYVGMIVSLHVEPILNKSTPPFPEVLAGPIPLSLFK